jgi:hypothetical protein
MEEPDWSIPPREPFDWTDEPNPFDTREPDWNRNP